MDSNTQVEPLDALIFFLRRITRPRTTNLAQMASGLASPYPSAPNTPAANAYGGTPGQGCGTGAAPPVQPGIVALTQGAPVFASSPIGVPNLPAAPTQSGPPTYGGLPDQEYGSDAGAQVQPQGYGPGFTGSVNTQTTQTPSGMAIVGPYAGQDFELAETNQLTQPAPPVNQPQIQVPTVPFRPRGRKWTRADYEEVERRIVDSPEIQDVALLRLSHTPGAPTASVNQSTAQAPPGFGQADADTVAKALREARETVGKVDIDALLDMMRVGQQKRLAAGDEAGPGTAAPSVAKTVEETEPGT